MKAKKAISAPAPASAKDEPREVHLERRSAGEIGKCGRRSQRGDHQRRERRPGADGERGEDRGFDPVLREQLRGGRAAAAQRRDLLGLPLHQHRGDDQQVVGDDAADLQQQHEERDAHEEQLLVEGVQHLHQLRLDAHQPLRRQQAPLEERERRGDRGRDARVEPLEVDLVDVAVARGDRGDRPGGLSEEGFLGYEQQVGGPPRCLRIEQVGLAVPVALGEIVRLEQADDFGGERCDLFVPERVQREPVAEGGAKRLRRRGAEQHLDRPVRRHARLGQAAGGQRGVLQQIRAEAEVPARPRRIVEVGRRRRARWGRRSRSFPAARLRQRCCRAQRARRRRCVAATRRRGARGSRRWSA